MRYPSSRDAAALFALAKSPEVTRFLSWGPYRHEREAEAWLTTLPKRRASGVALEFAVVDRTDKPIGITLLSELHRRDRRAVVGTWLGRPYWGTGANRETKALVTHLAFRLLALERLGAYADVRNIRSHQALEQIGFTREGVLRGFHRHNDVPRDVALYSLMQEQWTRSELAQLPVQVSGTPPRAFVIGY